MIVTILRKPLEGTVAGNTLKYGCGGLNLAKSRIGNEEIKTNGWGENEEVSIYVCKTKDFVGETRKGRWPANVILKHKQGCELKGDPGFGDEGGPSRFFKQISEKDTINDRD